MTSIQNSSASMLFRHPMPPDQFAAYLKGSAMKYLWRYENKGEPLNDLRKAKTFIEFLIAHVNQQ